MKAMPMSPVTMKVMPMAFKRGGHIGIGHLLAYGSNAHNRQQPADTGAEPVDRGRPCVGERPLLHEERTSQDGTVHCNERQEDTQRIVKCGGIFLDYHLDELYHGCHDGDEKDETQKAEIDIGKRLAEPRKGPGFE